LIAGAAKILKADVSVGSNSEELNLSKCLPGYIQKRIARCSRHVLNAPSDISCPPMMV
jgi:hypothetical protein